jgi:hypothetical protein
VTLKAWPKSVQGTQYEHMFSGLFSNLDIAPSVGIAARYMVCMPPTSTAMRVNLSPLSVMVISVSTKFITQPILLGVTDLSESRRYPLPAGQSHPEPACHIRHIPQPDEPGAMLGGN